MVQSGQSTSFTGEAFGESRVVADARGKNLEGDGAIQLLLPCLIYGAHTPFTEESKDFKLRKKAGQLFWGGRHEKLGLRMSGGVRRRALLQKAGGAKPSQHARGEGGAALWTFA